MHKKVGWDARIEKILLIIFRRRTRGHKHRRPARWAPREAAKIHHIDLQVISDFMVYDFGDILSGAFTFTSSTHVSALGF